MFVNKLSNIRNYFNNQVIPMFLKVEIYEFINKFKNKHLDLKIKLLNIIDLYIG